MLDSFRKLLKLLNPREKRSLVVLIGIILAEGLLEMLGVGIVPLYITALAYPESVLGHAALEAALEPQWQAWLTRERLIVWGGVVILVFFTVKATYVIAAAYWKARFAQNRALKLSLRLFTAYMHAPYVFHLQHNAAELLRNINQECTQLANRVLMPMVEFVSHAVILCGICLVLIYALPAAVLAWLAAFLAAGIGTTTLLQNRVKRLGLEAQHYRGRVVQTVTEGLGGVKEIKLLQRVPHFVGQLAAGLGRILAIQRIIQLIQRAIPSIIELIGIIGLVGVTLMLLATGSDTQQLVTALSVFAVALTRMKGAVRGIMDTYTEFRHHSPSLDVVYDGLQALEQSVDDALAGLPGGSQAPPPPAPMPFTRHIELVDLSYRYPGATGDSLRSLDLAIARGEAVGFVGSTGAGKSTLLDLILGVLQPTRGCIRVDGRDIQTAPAAWQRNLGYVPQAFFLIDGTLRENIALGMELAQIDHGRVAQAATAAELNALIARLPAGSDTVIGERGIRLSGGERQRIAIARALYHNPDILVMDEATSALDNTTEAAVIDAVASLKGDRTILMVAHRLSTVRRCDRIVFLKDGVIDAIGTYEELQLEHTDFRLMTKT